MALPFILADASNYQFHKREQVQLQYVTFEQFLPTLGLTDAPPETTRDKFVRALAEEALRWPLPPHWTEQFDDSLGAVYFFHARSGTPLWVCRFGFAPFSIRSRAISYAVSHRMQEM